MADDFDLDAELQQWSRSMPLWQQYALMLLAENDPLSPEQEERVFQAVLAHHGLGEWPQAFRGYELRYHPAADPDAHRQPCRLRRMQNLEGINALCQGQTLEFSDGLTIVYGLNGSGKSGYARVLAQACGEARVMRDVLPNAFADANGVPRQSAELVLIAEDGSETAAITWHPGEVVGSLSGLRFIDSEAVGRLVSSPSTIALGPAVLGIFKRLADLVRDVLTKRRDAYVESRLANPPSVGDFGPTTGTGRFVSSLSASSDVAELAKLARLGKDDQERLAKAREDVTSLDAKLANLDTEQNTLTEDIAQLDALAAALRKLRSSLSPDLDRKVTGAALELQAREEAVARAAAEDFACGQLPGTSTPSWRLFIRAARSYADTVAAQRGDTYPRGGDVCLFCRQPLSADASALIQRYWSFLTDSDAAKRDAAASAVSELRTALQSADTGLLDADKAAALTLKRRSPTSLDPLTHYVAQLASRKEELLGALAGDVEVTVSGLPEDLVGSVTDLRDALKRERVGLERAILEGQRSEVCGRVAELGDREKLSRIESEVRDYIARAKEADLARKIPLETASITRKQGQLHNRVVSPDYVTRFKNRCTALGCSLPVEPSFSGDIGARKRQLRLVRREDQDDAADKGRAVSLDVDQVLSEGEQRAVALADFLTEAEVLPGTASIVLDDPVNSLDHRWAERLAWCLAQEANRHQVVVFTHDLAFAYALKAYAVELKPGCLLHLLSRSGTGTGEVRPPEELELSSGHSSAKLIRQKWSSVEARYERGTTESQLQSELGQLVDLVRQFCEAFTCNKLLKSTVKPFQPEVKVGKLPEVVWDEDTVSRLARLHSRASSFLPGHYHAPQEPRPLTVETVRKMVLDVASIDEDYTRPTGAAGSGGPGTTSAGSSHH